MHSTQITSLSGPVSHGPLTVGGVTTRLSVGVSHGRSLGARGWRGGDSGISRRKVFRNRRSVPEIFHEGRISSHMTRRKPCVLQVRPPTQFAEPCNVPHYIFLLSSFSYLSPVFSFPNVSGILSGSTFFCGTTNILFRKFNFKNYLISLFFPTVIFTGIMTF